MGLNLEPVKVSIEIETTSLARDAFYNICFITDNEKAPRTLKVERLKDLLDNEYDRSSLAYNFCVGVFAQQGIPIVYVRAKRALESYSDAFSADDNSNFYFVVIESKEIHEISKFNGYLNDVDEYKLQLHSSKYLGLGGLTGRKLVNYYQELDEVTFEEDYYLKKAYKVKDDYKYASHPYPALLEEGSYQSTVTPLNFTLRRVLHEGFSDDAYSCSVKPLDITLRSVYSNTYVDDDVYTTSIKPLDITLRSIMSRKDVDDKYQLSVKPLDVTLKRVWNESYVDDDIPYISTIKPLDITLKTEA